MLGRELCVSTGITRITCGDVGSGVDGDGNIIVTPGNTGNRLFGAPRQGGSLWGTWHPSGRWTGLKLGLGAVARSWREGDNQNDYRVPGFVKWRVLAGYEWPWNDGRLAVQLNADNLFSKRYFEPISGNIHRPCLARRADGWPPSPGPAARHTDRAV